MDEGPVKAAKFLLALDRSTAREVLARLPAEDRRSVGEALAELSGSFVPASEIDELLEEFQHALEKAEGRAVEAREVQTILSEVLGEDAEEILSRRSERSQVRRARTVLENLDGSRVAFALQDEHPQTTACLLLALGPEVAARILPHFDDEARKDLVERMIGLKMPAPEIVGRMILAAARKVGRLPQLEAPIDEQQKLKAVATVLNRFDESTQKAILDSIEAADADRAQKVREQLFTFDDLLKLGPRDIQRILSGIDTRLLATALKGASPELQELLLSNVSSRVRDRIEEERETLGALRLSEVRKAQAEMAAVARDLIQRGEIAFGGGGDELVE